MKSGAAMLALFVVPAVVGLGYLAATQPPALTPVAIAPPPDVPAAVVAAARPPDFDAVGSIRKADFGALPGAVASPGALAYAPVAPRRDPIDDALAQGRSQLGDDLAMPLAVDADALREAIGLYRKGDLAGGDAIAARFVDPATRATLEWAALRLQPRPAGWDRIANFLRARPDWPSARWLEGRAEEALYADRMPAALVRAAVARRPPTTASGKLALARAALEAGDKAAARKLVVEVWRNDDASIWLEKAMLKEFGELLTRADHKFRADRLLYDGKSAAAERAAQLAGPDAVKIARVRAIGNAERSPEAAIAALPKELQADPGVVFTRAQGLRRANKFAEAAALLIAAPRDPALVVDGDAWWTERRIVARKLLDLGDAETAYKVAATHAAESSRWTVEAEFHAGWIALRFLNGGAGDAALAKPHFDRARAAAESPISLARAAYWQGRAAEALGDDRAMRAHYLDAAQHSATYYGQLARARMDEDDLALRMVEVDARSADSEVVRVVELLYAIGEKKLALPLAVDAARGGASPAEISAISQVMRRQRDARGVLIVGKLATQHGAPLDDAAFPTFGVPDYQPAVSHSAEKAMVYSIARQESAFQTDVVSHAGAKGLMQMIDSTARRTAERAGVAFDQRRMLTDPAFNAQLGAAHLGDLLIEQKGSYILTFAAYNAGGHRVRQWIAAYGDPRDGNVDPVDWVERIPFSETRDYVQRIVENLQVYRVRLGERTALLIDQDLRRVAR